MVEDDRIHFWLFRGEVIMKSGPPPTAPNDGRPAIGRIGKRFKKWLAEPGLLGKWHRASDFFGDPGPLPDRHYFSFNTREELFETTRICFNQRAAQEEERAEENWEREGPRLHADAMRFDHYVSLYHDHQEAYFNAVDAAVACVAMGDEEGAGLFASFCKEILERKSKGEIPWNEDRERLWRVEKRPSGEKRRSVATSLGVVEEHSSSESEPAPQPSSSPENPS